MSQLNTEFFRPSESKTVVGVSRSTIYNWHKAGKITIQTHGSMSFVSMAEVRKILNPLGDQLGDQS